MSFGGLDQSLRYFEFELDSYDNSGAYNSGTPATDWPIFYIGGKTPLENIAAIKIVEVQIPFTWYVINTTNNTFILNDAQLSPAAGLITIPVGNYTAASLATLLGTLMTAKNAAAGGSIVYTVTYDSVTGKFTFSNNTTATSSVFNLYFTFAGVNYLSNVILGFNLGGVNTSTKVGIVNGDFIISSNVALVTGPNYVYINSLKVGQLCNMYLPRGATNLGNGNAGPQMAKVPVNCQPGGVIFWQDPDNTKYFDLENLPSLTEIDFYLTLGNTGQTPLPLNGANFSLKIAVLTNDFTKNDLSGGISHEGRVVKRMRTN